MAITVYLRILKHAVLKKWTANAYLLEGRTSPSPVWQMKDLVLQQKGFCGITQLTLHHSFDNTHF